MASAPTSWVPRVLVCSDCGDLAEILLSSSSVALAVWLSKARGAVGAATSMGRQCAARIDERISDETTKPRLPLDRSRLIPEVFVLFCVCWGRHAL